MRQITFFAMLIAAFAMSILLVNAADIEDGLWLYLPLNEGTGEPVVDHGPHAFDTELSKAATKIGGCKARGSRTSLGI